MKLLFWRKPVEPIEWEIRHDNLCPKEPCICRALQEERREREREYWEQEAKANRELAKKLLDGQTLEEQIRAAAHFPNPNLARRLAGLPEYPGLPDYKRTAGCCTEREDDSPCYDCLLEAYERVKELHKPIEETNEKGFSNIVCNGCYDEDSCTGQQFHNPYPCPTIDALQLGVRE